jgi:hypothetical protein
MQFAKGDIIVITGLKSSPSEKLEVLADVYEVLYVGSHELLALPRTRHAKDPFKVNKHRCINVIEHAKETTTNHVLAPTPTLGSLVLGFDLEYSGKIKDKVIGHVSEIIYNTNSRTYYMVSSDNKQTMFEENKVLLLE